MKTGEALLLAAVGYGVIYYTGLGVAGNDLQVVFKGFSIDSITQFTVTLTIQNVSNATIQINSLAADVTVDTSDLGNVSYFGSPITIGANSQVDIPLKLNLSLFAVPAIVKDIMNNLGNSYKISVDGNFNANNIPLPLHLSDTITV